MLELNKIYNEDCLIGMKKIESGSIDLIVTDPPYNINLQPQRKKTKSIENDNMNKEDFINFIDSYFKECFRILKNDTFLITFLGWSTIPEFRVVCDKYFVLKSMPIWVKNNFGIGYYTRPQYEPMLLYLKGTPKPLENPISDIIKYNKIMIPVHSCEKPVGLLEILIRSFSKENDVIFDGFLGTSPIALASLKNNRKFIGFELDKEYYDISINRINEELEKNRVKIF